MKKYKSLDDLKKEKFNLKRELAENENYLKADINYLKDNYQREATNMVLSNSLRYAGKFIFKSYYLTKGLNAFNLIKRLRLKR